MDRPGTCEFVNRLVVIVSGNVQIDEPVKQKLAI